MCSTDYTPDRAALASTRVRDALREGLGTGEFLGAQVYASVDGEPLVDLALGDARVGTPMRTDTLVSWQCNTKPVTATALAMLWERDLLGIDDPIVVHIPGFGANAKDTVTVRHLLEHSAGFAQDPPLATLRPLTMDASRELVCNSRLVDGWRPGSGSLYSAWLGYAALGLVIEQVSGRPFRTFVREEVFGPVGMDDCWIGVPPEQETAVAERMALLYDTAGARPEVPPVGPIAQARGLTSVSPASGGIGPMRQLARLYESLLGIEGRPRLLRADTVAAMTSPVAERRLRRYGLGFEVGLAAFREQWPAAFGHKGLRSSMVLADPRRRIVIAVMLNGLGRGRNPAHLLGVADAVRSSLREVGLVEDPA